MPNTNKGIALWDGFSLWLFYSLSCQPKQQEKEVLSLQKDYDKLSDQTKERKDLAKKLKDDAFAEKYARAKYYYSREGESIYPVPSLLP